MLFSINLKAQHENGMTLFTAIGYLESPWMTVFENHQKCRISLIQFGHFPSIFVQLKLTCLGTLFN